MKTAFISSSISLTDMKAAMVPSMLPLKATNVKPVDPVEKPLTVRETAGVKEKSVFVIDNYETR